MKLARVKNEVGRSVEDKIAAILQEHPEGAEDAAFVHVATPQAVMEAINAMLAKHRLQLLKNNKGNMIYKLITSDHAARLRGMSKEDVLVMSTIQAAADMGIWMKDIRQRTGLPAHPINKSIKNLEERGLIKQISQWNQPGRKMYIMADLEPRKATVGSTWFSTNGTLDMSFVDTVRKALERIVTENGEATVSTVHAAIISMKLLREDKVSEAEIRTLLKSLEYDGKLESWIDEDDKEWFAQAPELQEETDPYSAIPCGVCPVAVDCTPDGPISPSTCVYYKTWLDF